MAFVKLVGETLGMSLPQFSALVVLIPFSLSLLSNLAWDSLSHRIAKDDFHRNGMIFSDGTDPRLLFDAIVGAKSSVRILATNGDYFVTPLRTLLKQNPKIRVSMVLCHPESIFSRIPAPEIPCALTTKPGYVPI